MKYNRTLVTLFVAIILLVIGTSNVYASTWSGADYSRIEGSSNVRWVQSVSNTPTVSAGSVITWDNCLYNAYSDLRYPRVTSVDNGNTQNDLYAYVISYGQQWTPQISRNAGSGSGDHAISVTHSYDTTYKGYNGPSASATQYYRI